MPIYAGILACPDGEGNLSGTLSGVAGVSEKQMTDRTKQMAAVKERGKYGKS